MTGSLDENKAGNFCGTFQKDEVADVETKNVQRKNPYEEVGEKLEARYFAKGYLIGGNNYEIRRICFKKTRYLQ